MIQTASEMYCIPNVNFQAKEWNINGKTVLEIIVPKSKYHKHKAPDHNNIYKVYIRVKDQNILADGILLKIWKYQNNKQEVRVTFTESEMFLLKYLNDNKRITLKEFMKAAKISKKKLKKHW